MSKFFARDARYETLPLMSIIFLEVSMEITSIIITELLNLIDSKKKLFDDIMRITQEQKKDIEGNEANNIEELVKSKQSIIDKVDGIDKAFAEKLNLLKKHLNINNLEELDFSKYPIMKTLKLKVEEIMSLAQNIMKIEESNKVKISLIMRELKNDMKQLGAGKKSIKAYETPVFNNDGIYIDKKK